MIMQVSVPKGLGLDAELCDGDVCERCEDALGAEWCAKPAVPDFPSNVLGAFWVQPEEGQCVRNNGEIGYNWYTFMLCPNGKMKGA